MSFDLRTHHINKEGKIIRETHYVLKISGGQQLFERPPKSGNWYSPDGRLVESKEQVKDAEDLLAKSLVEEAPKSGQSEEATAKSTKEAPTTGKK